MPACSASDGATFDIGVANGSIVEIAPSIASDAAQEDAGGKLVIPASSRPTSISTSPASSTAASRRRARLQEAIAQTAHAKRAFTEDDVYARGRRTLEKAIVQGTTRMRTHVEVDPRIGLTSFRGGPAPQTRLCVGDRPRNLRVPAGGPAQRSRHRGTAGRRPARRGADLIGGCPYTDSDPHGQIARIFGIAQRFDLDIDFHLDFDLDASWMDLDEVCRQTTAHGCGGRVAIGHVTKLSALPPSSSTRPRARLADAGVAVTVLPATDLFLMGRAHDHNVPRGVTPAHRMAGAWRDLLARHQQRAQPVHAVRRLLADPDGEPLRQHRAGRHAARACRLFRSRDAAAGAADEPPRLRHRGRQPGRPRGARQFRDPARRLRKSPARCSASSAGRRSFVRAAPVLFPPA